MKKTVKCLALASAIGITGCTSVKVQPVSSAEKISHICIKKNNDVIRADFLPTVQNEIEKHGISTSVYDDKAPKSCNYTMTYTALQSWDFTPYLSHAELRLFKENRKISEGIFHLNGKGGLAFTKFNSTQKKMAPVVEQMLQHNISSS